MQYFKKIIDSASQAEQAFIKLSIAEKSISQFGVDITPQELTDIIEKVSAAYYSQCPRLMLKRWFQVLQF